MNILCVICQDILLPADEEVFSTHCGHVFHFRCLSQWLESSQTCPQCRKKATENSIYKVFFTFSESETASENGDSSSLQGRIESLQFQLLMKESNIKHYTSKNVTLEKQNAGLRQEVRKVESEINQKNATIHILKEQITYFKEKYGKYKVLTQKLSQKEKELEQFQNMRNTFSNGSFEDIKRMIEKTKDNDTLVTCFSVMKKLLSKSDKIKNLPDQLTVQHNFFVEKLSKEFEERLDFCKRENLALRHRVNELENHICEFDNQGNSNKNSSNIIQKVNVYSQTNTKRKIENQNTSLSPRIKTNVIKMNQEDLSTTHECPSPTIKRTIIKRTKLHGQSAGNVNQAPVQVNPQTDQSDYSAQWAKYYRSIGKHREADMIAQSCGKGPPGLSLQGTRTHSQGVHHTHSTTRLKCHLSIVFMWYIGLSLYQRWRQL